MSIESADDLCRALSCTPDISVKDENMSIESADDLCHALSCTPDISVKVVSIFGNTGDGKSYTLNHALFGGHPVFETSGLQRFGNTGDGKSYTLNHALFGGHPVFETSGLQSYTLNHSLLGGHPVFETSGLQDSCTAGAWAALCPEKRLVAVDTEGMLAVSTNDNARKRLLLKVLAVSDVVVYCTKAERLHQDMFHFLEDASAAYCSYFERELRSVAERTGSTRTANVGPALVIFHETRNTSPLGAEAHLALLQRFSIPPGCSISLGAEAHLALLQRFFIPPDAGETCFPLAYSDVKYVGQRREGTSTAPTDFEPLRQAVYANLEKTTVRLHRPAALLFAQLQALNARFS
ncbi:hypothetical protein T484DRAFT_1825390 [Baffinella frigidus]|nr:hypothetical protein T484DRAFT_1825390 [Cryptophyta sp. CCMP2293]